VTLDREIAAARETLARFGSLYGLAGAPPVPVEDIADSLFGLLVVDVPGMAESGTLRPARCEVHVNADETAVAPRRRRFTIAHEIGHWVLHAAGDRDRIVYCRITDGEAVDPIEREANRFAAELLMPEPLVRAAWVGEHGDVAVRAAGVVVSEVSMGWRVLNLGLTDRGPT
jgi:hypothetical protein